MANICEQVFGKRYSLLTAEERQCFSRLHRAVTYFRDYEHHKQRNRTNQKRGKQRLLELLGWEAKCMQCGYDRCLAALDFHHLDPTQKSFSVSRFWHNGGLVAGVEEARKCQLICANCHRECDHKHRKGQRGRPRDVFDPLVVKYMQAAGLSEDVIQLYQQGR